ncbi:MAG: PHP domain-containing protein [Clostridia bacterium]
MQVTIDLHTHTLVSHHAYSTLWENCTVAKRNGVSLLAMTDHGYGAPDSGNDWHFGCMGVIPDMVEGVRVLKGAEANIMDSTGRLDLDLSDQRFLDFMLASLHDYVLKPSTKSEHTHALEQALCNPWVDAIAHPAQVDFPFDEAYIVKLAAQQDKCLELNPHAMLASPMVAQINLRLLHLAKRYQTMICLGSDAHFCNAVGNFDSVYPLLEEAAFPHELILNMDESLVLKRVAARKQRAQGK